MQAKTGGQVGLNGEFYKGGQFLPSTTLPKMQQGKIVEKPTRQEVAPYVWELTPEPGLKSIYRMIRPFVTVNTDGTLSPLQKQQPFDWYGVEKEQVKNLCERWNDGETWIDESESIYNT